VPVLKLLILLILLMLVYQDFKYRMVYAVLFPVLCILFVWHRWLDQESFSVIFSQCAAALLFLGAQLALLTLYFSFRFRRWTPVSGKLLAWGDILLLAAIGCYLSFLNYVLFYLLSAVATLLCWMIAQAWRKKPAAGVPLAGFQALFFAMAFIYSWVHPSFSLQDERWMYQLTGQ
jgi:hypothetical protein